MEKNELILDVKGLRTFFYASRGIVKAVNNISFTIKKGEVLGLVGESGCGKTVVELSILQMVPYPGKIVTGEIIYKGENLLQKSSSEMVRFRGKEIGVIFQDPMSSLNPLFTIGEQISSGILAHNKISKQKAIDEAVRMLVAVNMPDPERRIRGYQHELSGGMKQRVMIALALSCNPSLLIADNPTTALDSTIQLQFLNLILDLRRRLGMTILYITHEFGIAAKLCDRVMVLYAGEIIEMGSVYNVLKNPKHPYTRALIASTPASGMRNKKIEAIEGKPPDLVSLPVGCKFASRCKEAMPECTKRDIDFFEFGKKDNSHLVRCLLYK